MTNLLNSLDSDHFDLTESLLDSTCSELERLEPESRGETPAERAIANTRKEEDRALRLIQEAQALGANTLDLSNKGLIQIPDELLRLQNLEVCHCSLNRKIHLTFQQGVKRTRDVDISFLRDGVPQVLKVQRSIS